MGIHYLRIYAPWIQFQPFLWVQLEAPEPPKIPKIPKDIPKESLQIWEEYGKLTIKGVPGMPWQPWNHHKNSAFGSSHKTLPEEG